MRGKASYPLFVTTNQCVPVKTRGAEAVLCLLCAFEIIQLVFCSVICVLLQMRLLTNVDQYLLRKYVMQYVFDRIYMFSPGHHCECYGIQQTLYQSVAFS